jgi:hypothetical protein
MLGRVGSVVVIALLLALCGVASAKIVLGSSIDGVKLGMSQQQVGRILGKGKQAAGDPGQYLYRHDSYQVVFASGRVTSVETFDKHQLTSGGLGVGDTRTKLRAHLHGLHCTFDRMDGTADCVVGSIKRGHRYTDFFFDDKLTVTAVIVGDGYL